MTDQQAGSYMGMASFALTILGAVYAALNHRRVRSNCCGSRIEASLDIENTTPPRAVDQQLSIKIPYQPPPPPSGQPPV
jgi:hypothetical protein